MAEPIELMMQRNLYDQIAHQSHFNGRQLTVLRHADTLLLSRERLESLASEVQRQLDLMEVFKSFEDATGLARGASRWLC